MAGWLDAMNADILAYFDDVDYPGAEVVGIAVDTEDRGPGCRSCSWTVFVVEVAFDTSVGRVTRTYEGNIADFLREVWEAGEKQRELTGPDPDDSLTDAGDYGWAHRRYY